MPRQARWVAAGVYQPTYQPRHAYGPRDPYRDLLNATWRVGEVRAAALARYHLRHPGGDNRHLASIARAETGADIVAVAMPRGGVRWLLICPRCHRRAAVLYGQYHNFYRRFIHACRQCWGLRYASQYAGRRIEAHPDYLQAVMRRQIDRTPHEPRGYYPVPARRQMARIRHILRMGRYQRAHDLLERRTQRYIARREIALDLALAVLVAQSEALQRSYWRGVLRKVLPTRRRPLHAPTVRGLIAAKDTPTWVKAVLQEALDHAEGRAEQGDKLSQQPRKGAKQAPESDETAQLVALIEQARLDDLRARYAALSPAPRRKRAA